MSRVAILRAAVVARRTEASLVQAAKSIEGLLEVLASVEDLPPALGRRLDPYLANMAQTLADQADGLTAIVLDILLANGAAEEPPPPVVRPAPRLQDMHPLRGSGR